METNRRNRTKHTSGITSIDFTDKTNKVLVNGDEYIIMPPSITVLSQSNITIAQNVSCGSIVFIAESAHSFRFNSPSA